MVSCHREVKKEETLEDLSEEHAVKPFFADNYPVTDKMFGKGTGDRPFKTKHLISDNTAWFTNDSLKQTLNFILSSDNDRLVTCCFDNNNTPNEVVTKWDVRYEKGNTALEEDKLLYYKEFYTKAPNINSKYFTSNKGFKLGDPKEKAIKQYGKPDSVKTVEGFEKYYWNPIGAQITQKEQNVSEKDLLLIDEKKQFIIMYFKNNKLATVIFNNVGRPIE